MFFEGLYSSNKGFYNYLEQKAIMAESKSSEANEGYFR